MTGLGEAWVRVISSFCMGLSAAPLAQARMPAETVAMTSSAFSITCIEGSAGRLRDDEQLGCDSAANCETRSAHDNLDGTDRITTSEDDLRSAGDAEILELSPCMASSADHAEAVGRPCSPLRQRHGALSEHFNNERELVAFREPVEMFAGQAHDMLDPARLPVSAIVLDSEQPEESLGELVAAKDPFAGQSAGCHERNFVAVESDITLRHELEKS